MPSSSWIASATVVGLLPRELPVGRVLDRPEDEPVPGGDAPALGDRRVLEPPRVVRVRRERGQLRPQAPRLREEDPAVGRHRDLVAEQVLEHGRLRLVGLRALRDLRELVRVAEEDDVARRVPDRDHVGERDLPRLVDDQRVEEALELLPHEEPRRAGDELQLLLEQVAPVVGGIDEVALEARVLVSLGRLLAPDEREALLARLALDLGEQLVDRLVAERRDADAPARAHERDRRLRALPRLARAGRALDEEVAAVERERGLGHREVEPRPRRPPLEDLGRARFPPARRDTPA